MELSPTARSDGSVIAIDGAGLQASVAMNRVDDLQLAFDASDLAAELAPAHFESGVSSTPKADGSPIAEADWAVEHVLREALSEARPEDAFLGEELGQLGESERVWRLRSPASHLPLVELVRGEIDARL